MSKTFDFMGFKMIESEPLFGIDDLTAYKVIREPDGEYYAVLVDNDTKQTPEDAA